MEKIKPSKFKVGDHVKIVGYYEDPGGKYPKISYGIVTEVRDKYNVRVSVKGYSSILTYSDIALELVKEINE